ncbi:MAG TPA: signal peptidase I [Bryobacteraceae bacterium]|jgi:signal peptidase I|nr:signal peptidase I [Bryobacteraceae bacterium]
MSRYAESVRNFVHEWSLNILILLFGTTTLVQAFIVPTPSMDTTVMVGDHLLVDKLSYAPPGSFARYLLPYTDPKRGDIIVFRYPMDISQNYVKRVMGVPGDHIKVVDKVVYLNGKALKEPYAQHIFPNLEPYRDNFPSEPRGPVAGRAMEMLAQHVVNGELVVPPESYFAMGDNRDNSLDSRYWGFVPRENIIGKPLLIFWSYDAPTADLVGYSADHFLDLAKNFFFKTRWDRELKLVRGFPVE